jgi:hypothetical protein
MESATDKFLLSAVTFAADLEREKGRQRTYDAMLRKARSGHVTGGRLFGYDNIRVNAGHVERRINEAEAAVIRQIFHSLDSRPRREGDYQAAECRRRRVPAGATRTLAVVGAELRSCSVIPRPVSWPCHLEPDAEAQPVGQPQTGAATGG